MKKALLILLSAWILTPAGTEAQNIILGEKVPEFKPAGWIDNRHPAPAALTYVEFFHSSNPACLTSIERLREIAANPESRMRIIIITREDTARIARLLRPYLSERVTAAIHGDRGFASFGVTYLPFGVLIDARHRALWMGNSLQINKKIIEQSTR